MSLNAFYEDELSYLRDLGSEFARINPKLSSFLGREASDPDVERLIEGFAFLTARLRQRLDDELPELSHSLIRLIWPHYLRPIPPLTMLRFEPGPSSTDAPQQVAAGSRVRSRPIEGVTCGFATCHALDLLPFSLGEVEFESRPTSAVLRFKLKAVGKASLAALSGRKLRLFFNTERDPQTGRALALWFLQHVRQVAAIREDGSKLVVDKVKITAGGFRDDEAVLPWPKNTFGGFRLLQEYLVYPTKFNFIEISGLDVLAAETEKHCLLSFEFNRPFPAQMRVNDQQIRLNCVPAINLFDHDAEPIRAANQRNEYRVQPLGGGHLGIYSIESVVAFQQGQTERRPYVPFESFRHDGTIAQTEQAYFRERLRPSVTGRGVDTFVSFADRAVRAGSGDTVVSIRLKCTNGALAGRLAIGGIDQPTTDIVSGVTVSNVTSVSPEIPPPIGHDLLWRLVTNLARNYLPFSDITSLRSVIEAYDFQAVADVQAKRRLGLLLQSLVSVSTETRDTLVRGIPARLRHMTLSVDDAKIGGEAELFFLGSVLDAFFANYLAINALHQFAIQGLSTKALFEWAPRFGNARAG